MIHCSSLIPQMMREAEALCKALKACWYIEYLLRCFCCWLVDWFVSFCWRALFLQKEKSLHYILFRIKAINLMLGGNMLLWQRSAVICMWQGEGMY